MMTAQYCRTMAQYNQWQNNGLRDIVKQISDEDMHADRGAFFGSILATLNHIMWGDTLWLMRLGVLEQQAVDDLQDAPDANTWSALRFKLDGTIMEWARRLKDIDLTGEIRWRSSFYDKDFVHPRSLCITHMFNHQTHHRGQVHGMLTALGLKPIDTDLIFMPET